MLTGKQKGILLSQILDSFNAPDFIQLMTVRLEKDFYHYTSFNGTFKAQVLDVIQAAVREGWVSDFLLALMAERPGKDSLVSFIATFQLSHNNIYDQADNQIIDRGGLEGLVSNDPMLDGIAFASGLLNRMRCVCRIETVNQDGNPLFGTGFLVGPDLVMTNYHVVEAVIKNSALMATLTFKFDYFIKPDGSINTGFDVSLANNGILSHSPYGPFDVAGSDNVNVDWPDDQFDYALLRINRELGDETFGINAEHATVTDDNKRGWIKAATNANTFLRQGGDIIIVQHPDKQPIKVAIGFGKVTGCDQNDRRVRYSVNTLGGSSGSPCFNKTLQWTALHNMGDTNWLAPSYNQGIPVERILQHLSRKGFTLN